MKKTALSLLAAALLAPLAATAQTTQTTTTTTVVGVPASQDVARLAPQLIAFAGGQANFDNLVNGLALGTTVTLATALPNGQTQLVTFTPAGTLAPLQIAQTLEAARQGLISRGIAAPTGQQLAITLAGGALPTPTGNVQVNAALPSSVVPVARAPNETVAANPRVVDQSANPNAAVTTTNLAPTGSPSPAAILQGQTGSGTPPSPAAIIQSQRGSNVSDTPTLGNTSNTPSPAGAGGTATIAPTVTPERVAPNGTPFVAPAR